MADISEKDRKRERLGEAEEMLEKTNKNLAALNNRNVKETYPFQKCRVKQNGAEGLYSSNAF